MYLWIAIIFVIAVLFYAAANVVSNMRKSEQDWQQTDKTKLKKWDDDEDEKW